MRILVTGGAGYIGSHVVRQLLRAGHEVYVFDNLTEGHSDSVAMYDISVPVRVGELECYGDVLLAVRDFDPDAVVHLAGKALVGQSCEVPLDYYVTNVVGTIHLLEAMNAHGVRKLIFSSTTATYGVPTDGGTIKEWSDQAPVNPYGRTKLAAEMAIKDCAAVHGIDYVIFRFFNAAGASPEGDIGEDHRPESHLIPLVLQVALGQRDSITIHGDDYGTPDGTCVRDFIHVDDLARAHVMALERMAAGRHFSSAFNLGLGRGYSVREVIESCRRVTGHPIPVEIGPRRPGDPPQLVADTKMATCVLGWSPRYTELDEIVATAWKWHSTHPNGYGG